MEPKFCRDGFDCVHFQIEDLCRELKNAQLKTHEDIDRFENRLELLKNLVQDLENLILPALRRNQSLPCLQPNTISWGRYNYQHSLREKLEQARQERVQRDRLMIKTERAKRFLRKGTKK